VIDGVAQYANRIFDGDKDTALIIDEFGISKKGEKSVGVRRQWNGRLGKVDNCQVAVLGVLSARASSCPIDIRLYLPESWTNDPDRCASAGVPEGERMFKTQIDLAQEIIDHAVAQGIDFKWVGFDAL
jgi:SRSO17 transposase